MILCVGMQLRRYFRMIARLKERLGDQKIDIIGDHEQSPVAQAALKEGILLI